MGIQNWLGIVSAIVDDCLDKYGLLEYVQLHCLQPVAFNKFQNMIIFLMNNIPWNISVSGVGSIHDVTSE
jgi:hypothetical protein